MKKYSFRIIYVTLIFIVLFCSGAIAKEKAVLTNEEKDMKTAELLKKLHKNFGEYKELILNNGNVLSMTTKQMNMNNLYRSINNINGSVVEADVLMANNALLFNDFEDALKILERGLKYNPGNIELLLLKIRVYFLSKKNDDVLDTVHETLKYDPVNVEALIYASIASRKLKKYDESLKNAENVIEIYGKTNPSNTARGYTAAAETYLILGTENSSNEYTKKALENINKAIETEPNVYRYNIRFAIYDGMHKYEDALKDLKEITKLDFNTKTLFREARYLSKLLKYEESIDVYSKVIVLDPKESNAYMNRGMLYADAGKITEAETDYKATIKLNPKDPYVYNALGVLYSSQGKYKEALTNYKTQKKVNPELKQVYFNETV